MAKARGCAIEYPNFGSETAPEVTVAWAKARELVHEADAYVIETRAFFEQEPEHAVEFHKRVKEGRRAIIFPKHGHQNSFEWWNRFLARYDLTVTWVSLTGPSDQRLDIAIRRADDCFRHPPLFANVDTVVFDTPFALWYGGESFGPCSFGSAAQRAVDAATDLPANWNARELACIGAWYGGDGGAVLAIACQGLFDDPATDPFGQLRRGIERNLQFADNVLAFLCEGRKTPGPSRPRIDRRRPPLRLSRQAICT